MTKASVPFNMEERYHVLKDPEAAALYLESCLEAGDMELFQEALKNVAKAQGGMSSLAKETGLSRESLYRSLSNRESHRWTPLQRRWVLWD